jgi:hypothetical protein
MSAFRAIQEREQEGVRLVRSEDRPRCKCGTKLMQPVSVRRGLCAACFAGAGVEAPRKPIPDPPIRDDWGYDQDEAAVGVEPELPVTVPPTGDGDAEPTSEEVEAVAKPAFAAAPIRRTSAGRPRKTAAPPFDWSPELGQRLAAWAGKAPSFRDACRKEGVHPRNAQIALCPTSDKNYRHEFAVEVRKGWPKKAEAHGPAGTDDVTASPAREELAQLKRSAESPPRSEAAEVLAVLRDGAALEEALGVGVEPVAIDWPLARWLTWAEERAAARRVGA